MPFFVYIAVKFKKQVAAIVLAAGASSRMGERNKLLVADADGRAMVARVVAACCASVVAETVVVTGHQAACVEAAVRGADGVSEGRVRFVRAAGHGLGMSVSLQAGIAALGSRVDAAVVCLGDMPLVTAAVIDQLIAAYAPAAARAIVVPVFGGRRGNPVLWDRKFFGEMMGLRGDVGARGLLGAHASEVVEVEVGSAAVLVDFDTPESFGGWGF